MGWFSSDSDQAQSADFVQSTDTFGEEHKAKLSHELIGGAAAYEAAKAYEDHVAKNGQPDSNARAKEVAAGFAGAFVDRIAETKGADLWDREQAKREARRQTDQAIDSQGY